jgi:hypothetical protein
MRPWANAANTSCDSGHFFHRPPDAESLETPEFDNAYSGIGDIAGIIELN